MSDSGGSPRGIMSWFNIVSWFKALHDLPVAVLVAIIFVLGAVLFAPEPFAEGLGFTAFLEIMRPVVGVVFLASLTLAIARIVAVLYERHQERVAQEQELMRLRNRLYALTAQEKRVLRKFVYQRKRVVHFSLTDGVVHVLEAELVLSRAASTGYAEAWPYFIQHWAWDYLQENPELLDADEHELAAEEEKRKREARRRAMW